MTDCDRRNPCDRNGFRRLRGLRLCPGLVSTAERVCNEILAGSRVRVGNVGTDPARPRLPKSDIIDD